jgi:hypothetical protein
VSTLVAASGRRPDSRPGCQSAADSGMAIDTSLATCVGHQLSGRRSFRKQRTVNPPIADNFRAAIRQVRHKAPLNCECSGDGDASSWDQVDLAGMTLWPVRARSGEQLRVTP